MASNAFSRRIVLPGKLSNWNLRLTLRTIFTELRQEELTQPDIKCRDRPFLAGSNSPNFPEYISKDVNKYFKGVKLSDANSNHHIKDIGYKFRQYIDSNIEQHSAFLLQGLPFNGVNEFQEFIAGMDYDPLIYDAGNAARSVVADCLYTSSDEPPEISMESHNEMSYLEAFPSKITFCCASAASYGGDSPVVFNRDLTNDLDPTIYNKVKEKKIRNYRNLNHEKNSKYFTWQEVFKARTEEEAEEVMKREHMSWEWQPNGDLSLWHLCNATIKHPVTGEEIWFNQVTALHCSYYKSFPTYVEESLKPNQFHLHASYGDGEELEEETIDEIRSTMWRNAMALKLMPGDILVLDNLLAMHSRTSYEGGERKIFVNLSW